ncbi:MAG: HAD family phosphatase [Flavobacteriaceae bacterium]|nr:HAD family phosphatase [Flavobacteriaceae bacterium]
MKDIQAFLFDMDGVVADTESQYDLFLSKLKEEYQLASDFVNQVKGTRLPDIMEKYFSHLSEEEKREIEDKVINFERNDMEYKYIPGASEAIRLAKKKGFKIGLVTSSLKVKVEVALKKLNLENTFDVVVTGNDVTQGKPEPQCYLLAADKLGVLPEKCLVFEDSFAGIEAGKRAKMKVIGLSTTNSEKSLADKVNIIIPDFVNFNIENILQ